MAGRRCSCVPRRHYRRRKRGRGQCRRNNRRTPLHISRWSTSQSHLSLRCGQRKLDQNMKRVACTIVSANYLHFGWTLAESFLKFHPDDEFHLLLVDQLPEDFISHDPRVHVLEVEKLDLPAFRSLAFKFDILELNTGVKPSFLKHLFALGQVKSIFSVPVFFVFLSFDLSSRHQTPPAFFLP